MQFVGDGMERVCRADGFVYELRVYGIGYRAAKFECKLKKAKLAGLQTDLDNSVFKEAR